MHNSYECYYIIELLVGLLCGVSINNHFLVTIWIVIQRLANSPLNNSYWDRQNVTGKSSILRSLLYRPCFLIGFRN